MTIEIKQRHEFDGVQAVGHWVLCEQVAVRAMTSGGLIVPEASRLVVWQALSCGELVTTCKTGDRLLFMNPQAGTVTHDGRTFALLKDEQIIAKLRMPDPDEAPRILPATATIGGMLQ